MDKIRIKDLVQGTTKINGLYYALGFVTKWGTVWVSGHNLNKFLMQNKHLKEVAQYGTPIYSEDLIGRYIYVQAKQGQVVERNGEEIVSPRLY